MQTGTKKKHKWLRILLTVVGVVVITIAIFTATSLYVSSPTKGTAISVYDNPRSALLVIDVQNDTTDNTAMYGDTAGFVRKVNQAVAVAEQSGMEIIYVKNVYGGNPLVSILSRGRYRRGTNGAELAENLRVVNGNIFSKSIGDSFSSKDFEDYLISKEINTLYIVGADAAACVFNTARGGTNRGYIVYVIEDAIITINEATIALMIKQYHSLGIETINLAEFENVILRQ
ncbi:MAG: cysteine hydrolase [Treponema sp.]|jgi:nicotinamidase-related amidase|nr:cysteine hydrolase [Treponema sp.]